MDSSRMKRPRSRNKFVDTYLFGSHTCRCVFARLPCRTTKPYNNLLNIWSLKYTALPEAEVNSAAQGRHPGGFRVGLPMELSVEMHTCVAKTTCTDGTRFTASSGLKEKEISNRRAAPHSGCPKCMQMQITAKFRQFRRMLSLSVQCRAQLAGGSLREPRR